MKDLFTFRQGTSDWAVFHDCYEGNEYRLPDRFEEGSVVLDIGAHIGSFTQACIDRGAAKVYAFEPEPENYMLFRKHLAPEIADGRVEVFPIAIVGRGFSIERLSGYENVEGEVNTGGCALESGFNKSSHLNGLMVPCAGMDDVLVSLNIKRVRLLKFDSEGSEYESLFRSVLLALVTEIVGEYHCFENNHSDSLLDFLNGFGFKTTDIPHENSPLGLFWAKR